LTPKDPDEQQQDVKKKDVKLTSGSAGKEGSVEKTKQTAGHMSNPNKPAVTPKHEKAKMSDKDSGSSESTVQFLKETWQEFRKISWPDRQQVIKETYSVLFLVTVITVMVLAFDYAVGKAVFEPLDKFSRKINSGAAVQTTVPPLENTVPVTPVTPVPPAGTTPTESTPPAGATPAPGTTPPVGTTPPATPPASTTPAPAGNTVPPASK
jgi:preprotein translocase SecE subunit